MNLSDFFERYNLNVSLSAFGAGLEWEPQDRDKDAAWDLYVEMVTRITTQSLPDDAGVEQTALDSVYSLFNLTRQILKEHGRLCRQFPRIAVIVLNQVVRPFTAKWHRMSVSGAFAEPAYREEFREDLRILQRSLRNYTRLLADVAGIEDLTNIAELP